MSPASSLCTRFASSQPLSCDFPDQARDHVTLRFFRFDDVEQGLAPGLGLGPGRAGPSYRTSLISGHRAGSGSAGTGDGAALHDGLVAFQASKVSGSPARRFFAVDGSQPFSRMQRSRTCLVDATNDTARQPVLAFWRYKIHCKESVPSAQSPETANCRSLMSRPRDGGCTACRVACVLVVQVGSLAMVRRILRVR